MKRYLILFISLVFLLTGCSSYFHGKTEVIKEREVQHRIKDLLTWLEEAPIVSNGTDKVKVLTEDGMWTKKVVSPPKGSVFLIYQDIAAKQRDGFFSFTSTQSESQYLIALSQAYKETKDRDLLQKGKLVAERLSDKIFFKNIKNTQGVNALIPRLTKYDFDSKQWVDKKEEVYTEDILTTALALMKYSEVTNTSKYDNDIEGLLNTITVLQKQIENEQSDFLHGGLYHYVYNYDNESNYKPSWNEYPLTLSADVYDTLTVAHNYFDDYKYVSIRNDYLGWVEDKTRESNYWTKNGLPHLSVNGRGDFVLDLNKEYTKEKKISTENINKMLYGLVKWKPELSSYYSENLNKEVHVSFMGNWDMSETLNSKALPTFSGENISVHKGYLAYYMKTLGKEEVSEEIILDIFNSQRMKGDDVSRGVWTEGVLTNIRQASILIRMLYELNFNEIK